MSRCYDSPATHEAMVLSGGGGRAVEEAEQPVPFTPRVQTALSKDKKGGDWERGGSECVSVSVSVSVSVRCAGVMPDWERGGSEVGLGDTFFSRGSMAAALRAAGASHSATSYAVPGTDRR
eukprot:3913838-Rhodomonas_salina.1